MATRTSKRRETRDDGVETSARQRILSAAFAAFTEHGYAETSTLEIATRARVSKRELYALVGSKQDILAACINERAQRLRPPADLPELRDRTNLAQGLALFGARLLAETTEPVVIAVFRLAIAEAVRAPEVAQTLDEAARKTTRAALTEIMKRARSSQLVGGDPAEMAEQFAALLRGDLSTGLLLGVIDRPAAGEIARRARDATETLLRLYPAPEPTKRPG